MASFYGYGVAGKVDEKFYNMRLAIIGLDPQSYAEYCTFWFSITFIPCLLLSGPIISDWNRIRTLGWCTIGWGCASVAHGFAWDMWILQVCAMIIGFFSGTSAALTHQLVTDFFEKKYWTKAYFAFSILRQLGDSARFMTPVLIGATGWRTAWSIGGAFGILNGILLILTVSDPQNQNILILTKN